MVGPFIFFDHFGPATLPPGQGFDVRPHPHINLATVTYLFQGGMFHRDSLGSQQRIDPGAINWMTAGRGIVHSERTPPDLRATGSQAHGLQLWVALPRAAEELRPELPALPGRIAAVGRRRRWRGGAGPGGLGVRRPSPVAVLSPTIYAEIQLPRGGAAGAARAITSSAGSTWSTAPSPRPACGPTAGSWSCSAGACARCCGAEAPAPTWC